MPAHSPKGGNKRLEPPPNRKTETPSGLSRMKARANDGSVINVCEVSSRLLFLCPD